MTVNVSSMKDAVLVAIDIVKARNDVLVQLPNGTKKKFKVANKMKDYKEFIDYLSSFNKPCFIAFEATSNYHRPIAYHLQKAGFTVHLVSSFAAAKTREALHNSWDKNDPKDAQVILHLLKTGIVQTYYDPLINQYNDIQEIAKTYHQISLRKVRVQHSIMNHYLPLYFPEAEMFFHSSRALWSSHFISHFPTPSTILKHTQEEFINAAWDVVGRKVDKRNWLINFYQTAKESIGLPTEPDSQAIRMFCIILQEHQDLCKQLKTLEETAESFLEGNNDYKHLLSIPGIGPIIALTILAEAGDLKRFKHYREFLKFCGFDLSTQQSGFFRGQTKLSKFGNARLRYVFWLAATVAIRMRENTFRKKYEDYIKQDPQNDDLKRKGYTAVAAKIARVAYGIIKNETNYRCYHESVIPSGRIPSARP
ncbi:TPA: IS110 family transposase [Legionella pneumophila]|nr:IS110 family transposase [Legionella pneumophila]